MNNLVETVGFSEELEAAGIGWKGRNFEELYQMIVADDSKAEVARLVDDRIRRYFAALELPERSNIYDYLLLSLREKDVIATFNWDPFLWQAWERNSKIAKVPHILFLHGCAAIGKCRAPSKARSEMAHYAPSVIKDSNQRACCTPSTIRIMCRTHT